MAFVRTLRLLGLLGFLLLFAPFYQQCTFGKTADAPAEELPVEEIVVMTKADSLVRQRQNDSLQKVSEIQEIKDSISQDSIERAKPLYQKAYERIDDESNDNAFEMAIISFGFIKDLLAEPKEYWEQLKEDLQESRIDLIELPIRLISFVFIVVFSGLIVPLSFRNRFKMINRLAKWNLILLTLSLICICFDSFFDDFDQIKWGYYAFIFTQILILMVSRKLLNPPQK